MIETVLPATPPLCCRAIGVANVRVDLCSNDADIAERLNHLLAEFDDVAHQRVRVRIAIDRSADDAVTLVTRIDDEVVLTSPHLRDHEVRITREINQRLLDAQPELLHIHCAALARNGHTLLIVGRSRSGKSTFAAHLMRYGWEYITDEQLAIDPADGEMLAYPRPVTLRRPSWPHFVGLDGVPPYEEGRHDSDRVELAPSVLGATLQGAVPAISAIIVPDVGSGSTTLTPFPSTAVIVECLALNCFDLDRLGESAFSRLVEIAAHATAGTLDTTDLALATQHCEWAVAQPKPLGSVRLLPALTEDRTLPDSSIMRSVGVSGWTFTDGSTVLYGATNQAMTTLDSTGTALWELLASPQSLDELGAAASSALGGIAVDLTAWLEQLSTAGLTTTGG